MSRRKEWAIECRICGMGEDLVTFYTKDEAMAAVESQLAQGVDVDLLKRNPRGKSYRLHLRYRAKHWRRDAE